MGTSRQIGERRRKRSSKPQETTHVVARGLPRLPEGLARERKGPLGPHKGRGEKPSHVPQWKPE